MVKSPSCYVYSALHIIKGAACIAFSIPTARTTRKIKQKSEHAGRIVISKLKVNPSDSELALFEQLVRQKVLEDSRFRVFLVDRKIAESVYGDSIYDETTVSSNIERLRLVSLEEWNINAHPNRVLKSTSLLGAISIKNISYKPEDNSLSIDFQVIPPESCEEVLCEQEEINSAEECPPRAAVLPPGEEISTFDSPCALFNLEGSSKVSNIKPERLDYGKLIADFGCSRITQSHIERISRFISVPVHPFLRRGLFFSHRGLDQILDRCEKGLPFFVYTGRGPSSEALHLGHLVPFLFTCWLQKAFNVPVMVMLSDDEKFFFREEFELEHVRRMAIENAKDIIACGFDPDLTFIFRNTDYIHHLYPIVSRIQKKVTFNQVRGIFGFDNSSNIGKIAFPAIESAAAFCQCFPTIFGGREDIICLVPQGIDQDPFFRMTRDLAPRLGLLKPASLHSKFIPSLLGIDSKMSSSLEGSAIFVTDDAETIRRKIHKYAFSGGQANAKEQRLMGADLELDVSFQYLKYFLEDDERLEDIAKRYGSGEMLSGEIKNILVDTLVPIIQQYQERRKGVTDELLERFMSPNRQCFKRFQKN